MLIIGETFSGIIPKKGQAVVTRDSEAIATLARDQVGCGAQIGR